MLRELVIDYREEWRSCTPLERVVLVLLTPIYVPAYLLACVFGP